ncbi:MAG: pilus assembly protein [Rhodopirellula sp.]|nr:pilus assembly protein [Rhodopirellula sp.]
MRTTSRIQQIRPDRQRRRRGAVFLEFVVAMPILFFAFLAIFEFSFAMIAVDTSTTAAVQGAREGAFNHDAVVVFDNNAAANTDPTGNDDIADRIALLMDEYLGVINVEIRQNGVSDDLTKPNAYVRIVRGGVTAERGDATLAATCTQTGAAPAANEIVVTMCYPLVDASNPTGVGNPVPDWLSSVGFSLATYHFETTSRALLE